MVRQHRPTGRGLTHTAPVDLEARFWAKVDRSGGPDACWLWTAATHEHGYGMLRVNRRTVRAHRLAWEFAHGEVLPPEEKVLHACDTPPCVNSAHLSRGSQLDNIADMTRKGRQRGSRHSRLSGAQVRVMREMHSRGHTQARLALTFGVSPSYVSMILSGHRWRKETA